MILLHEGKCQFCGANTTRGVHECLEIFHTGFQEIDFSLSENHIFRFLVVDAHTLQHPEIHGRWRNHFHLSRLHLIFKYNVMWAYDVSPRLSNYLNTYKVYRQDEYLHPPNILERGNIKTTDIIGISNNEDKCKELIENWALEVYNKWTRDHDTVDSNAKGFLSLT